MIHQSIEVILTKAVEQRASDIHLTAGSPPIIRVDGSLITMGDEKVLPLHIESYLKEIMTEEMRGRLEMQRDLDFSFGVPACRDSGSTPITNGARSPLLSGPFPGKSRR